MSTLEALFGLNALWQIEFVLGLFLHATIVLSIAWFADHLLRHGPARRRAWIWALATLTLAARPITPASVGTLVVHTPAALVTIDNPVQLGQGARKTVVGALAKAGLVDAERLTTSRPGTSPGMLSWLFAAWATVVVVRWIRLMGAGRRVHAVLAASPRVATPIAAIAQQLMPIAGRQVRMVTSAFATPFTFGWRRPVVSLPASAADWDPDLVRSVLMHEFSHVRRNDWLRQIAATVVADLYWFHPLARLATRRMTLSAELQCDEQVLHRGVQPRAYAAHLLTVLSNSAPLRLAAAACFANAGDVETRIRAVIMPASPRHGAPRAIVALALGAIVPMLATVAPRLGNCEHSVLPIRMEWTLEP